MEKSRQQSTRAAPQGAAEENFLRGADCAVTDIAVTHFHADHFCPAAVAADGITVAYDDIDG